MADYSLPAPQQLGDIYSMNPGAFNQAQGLINTGQQFADTSLAQNQTNLAQDQAMNPIRQRQAGLNADTTLAQLPGIQGQSTLTANHAARDTATQDQQIQDYVAKTHADIVGQHVTDAQAGGTLLAQGADLVRAIPIGGIQRVKEQMFANGHGDMWQPAWDNADRDPAQVADEMKTLGENTMMTSQKVTAAAQMQNLKNQGTAYSADARVRAAQVAADQRAKTADGMVAMREQIAKIPKGLDQYQATMANAANEATDPTQAAKYAAQAQWAANTKASQMAAGAGVTAGSKVDPAAVGLPRQPAPAPQLPPPTGAPQVAPPGAGTAPPGVVNPGAPPGAAVPPNAQAINFLRTNRNNPAYIAQFEAKFGRGSSQAFLQGP